MKSNALLVGCLAAATPFCASATDEYNRTINAVGATAGPSYVELKEALSYPCTFGIVYLPDPNTGSGKAMLAVVLSAQSRSATLAAISYSADSSGVCTASNIRSN